MKSTIRITGIKAEGRHGANPGEQDAPQAFYIDVQVQVELQDDELDRTIDYEVVSEAVKEHTSNKSYKLIETLAYNIAAELNDMSGVLKAYVTVHKPLAADIIGAKNVSAEAMIEGNT